MRLPRQHIASLRSGTNRLNQVVDARQLVLSQTRILTQAWHKAIQSFLDFLFGVSSLLLSQLQLFQCFRIELIDNLILDLLRGAILCADVRETELFQAHLESAISVQRLIILNTHLAYGVQFVSEALLMRLVSA